MRASDPATAAPSPRGDRRRWLGLVVISLAVALVLVDITILNVAIPQIIQDLGLTSTNAQWVQEAFTLTFAALLLTWGRIADRAGRRRMLTLGVAIFTLASVAAALAPNGGLLVASRVGQGIGAAAFLPCTLSLLNATFRGRERVTAFAVWGATIGGAVALGPLLGGWLTTEFSWRWAFWVNLPAGVAVAAGVLAFVPESRDQDAAPGIDLVGAALSAIAAAVLVFGLIEGRTYGWWRATQPFPVGPERWPGGLSPVPLALVAALVTAAGFVAHQRRRIRAGRTALLDVSLFAIPTFGRGNGVVVIVALGQLGLLFVLPLWLQNVRGYSAFATGLILLPLALGSFAAAGAAPAIAQRRGSVLVVRLGLAVEVIGLAGVGVVTGPQASVWVLVPCLAAYGFGIGLAEAQLPNIVLADVPVARGGQASGTQSTAQEIGSALGIAILGTILFTSVGADLSDRLDDTGLPASQRTATVTAVTTSAGAAIPTLADQPGGQQLVTAAQAAFATGTRSAAFTAAGFLLLGLLVSAALRGTPQPHTSAHAQHQQPHS